jgi:hypothetical protein
MFRAAEDQAARYEEGEAPAAPADVRQTEGAEAGVQRAGQILSNATTARWPMYLRNVKQILRQADGGFDERRYGFGGLMDLLKGCQREGFVRIERDRRGGLRVFAGPALQGRTAISSTPEPVDQPLDVVDLEPMDTQPGEVVEFSDPFETEQPDAEPHPVDTTAELLGRAKPKRGTRTRPPRAAVPRKAAARKPAGPRHRAKKAAPSSHDEN